MQRVARGAALLCVCACVLLACATPASAKSKKKSKRSKAEAGRLKCLACVRMLTNSREAVRLHRAAIEPLRESKIETGRGADRVYNKRFTKNYDVELMHGVELVLEKSCAQPSLAYNTQLVKVCRTIRDDAADELVEYLLRGGDEDFCVSSEACAGQAAVDKVGSWTAPSSLSESAMGAVATWGLAVGAAPQGAVLTLTSESFLKGIVDTPGDVLLFLYDQKLGEHGLLPKAWDEVAAKMRAPDGTPSEADTVTFAALALGLNDVPIQLPADLVAGNGPEVLWFNAKSKDMAESLFLGARAPEDQDEFQQEIVRTLVIRGRERTYARQANAVLSALNDAMHGRKQKEKAKEQAKPSREAAAAKKAKDKARQVQGGKAGTRTADAAEEEEPWVTELQRLSVGWAAKPRSVSDARVATIRAQLEGVLASMDHVELAKSTGDAGCAEADTARLQLAAAVVEKERLSLKVAEMQTTLDLMKGQGSS